MVFEDIHWADSALLDFIEYLVEWSRDRPIRGDARAPELTERRPAWGAGTRNFTSIFLEPLQSEHMDSLLSDPIPGLPESVRGRSSNAPRDPVLRGGDGPHADDRGSSSARTGRSASKPSLETLEVPSRSRP